MDRVIIDIAAQVEQVLTRAASLFAVPAADHVADLGDLRSAVSIIDGLRGGAHQGGGQASETLNEQMGLTSQVLADAAQADEVLVEQLVAVAAAHARATQEAAAVLARTQETVAQAAAWAETPNGEVAVLRQLREQVASMQQILVDEQQRAAHAVASENSAQEP